MSAAATTSADSIPANTVLTVTTDSKMAAGLEASISQTQPVQPAVPGLQPLTVPPALNPSAAPGTGTGLIPSQPPPGLDQVRRSVVIRVGVIGSQPISGLNHVVCFEDCMPICSQ
jgi:hypothetical protein